MKGQESENHNEMWSLPQGLPACDTQQWSFPRWVDTLLSSVLAENNIRQPHFFSWDKDTMNSQTAAYIYLNCREKHIWSHVSKKPPCFHLLLMQHFLHADLMCISTALINSLLVTSLYLSMLAMPPAPAFIQELTASWNVPTSFHVLFHGFMQTNDSFERKNWVFCEHNSFICAHTLVLFGVSIVLQRGNWPITDRQKGQDVEGYQTHHCWRGNVDDWHGACSNLIDQLAEDGAVG